MKKKDSLFLKRCITTPLAAVFFKFLFNEHKKFSYLFNFKYIIYLSIY